MCECVKIKKGNSSYGFLLLRYSYYYTFLFFNEVFKFARCTEFPSEFQTFWNQSPYCFFNQFRCGSVIAFTILLLLKLAFISAVQIEYCPVLALVVNWWERKRLNYPGYFTGRGEVARALSQRSCYSVPIVFCGCCTLHFICFFCEIAPNMSAKWTASLLNRSFCWGHFQAVFSPTYTKRSNEHV